MKKFIFITLLSFFVSGYAQAQENYQYIAPSLLPNTAHSMKSAGYWIAKHPAPDRIIMDAPAIAVFNKRVRDELKLTKDILTFPKQVEGKTIIDSQNELFKSIKKKNYFLENGTTESLLFYQDLQLNLNMSSVPSVVEPQFALVTELADLRLLPTDQGLYAEAFDLDFDELQNSALDIGTPVVVLHKSFDGQWLFVESPLSTGWIKEKKVAVTTRENITPYLAAEDVVVSVVPKASLYLDAGLKKYLGYIRMGTQLPAVKQTKEGLYAVSVPTRKEGNRLELITAYLRRDQAHDGFLNYTPRNVLERAFLMLDKPYGWGGMYGEQDCSRFIQQVFAVFGIQMPRDSKNQAKAGVILEEFEKDTPALSKLSAFEKAIPAGVVLSMRGHIMLYVGSVNGQPYALHAVWAYREPAPEGDRIRVINRVALSDLNLGEGSKKGSLIGRLKSLNLIANTPLEQ